MTNETQSRNIHMSHVWPPLHSLQVVFSLSEKRYVAIFIPYFFNSIRVFENQFQILFQGDIFPKIGVSDRKSTKKNKIQLLWSLIVPSRVFLKITYRILLAAQTIACSLFSNVQIRKQLAKDSSDKYQICFMQ